MKNKWFIGLILAVFVVISAGSVYAQDSYNFELTEGFAFSEATDNWSIDISLPAVSGMADETEQAELNQYILSQKDSMLEDYSQNVLSAEQSVKEGYDPHFSYQYSWNIVTDNDDYYVFRITLFYVSASATELNEYFNLDKKTGKLLHFEDVVASPEQFESIRGQILDQMTKMNEDSQKEFGADVFWTDDDTLNTAFGILPTLNHWYYNPDNHLVITFDKYEIAPGVMGSPEFEVSLD